MSRLESLATLPKIAAVAGSSVAAAATTGAYEATVASVHWMQIVVWVCSAFGGLAAGVLACINGYASLQRILARRRRGRKTLA